MRTIPSFAPDTPKKTKSAPFDLCFFVMADSHIQIRGGEHGLYGVMRKVTYRCGMCSNHFTEDQLREHFDEHASKVQQ